MSQARFQDLLPWYVNGTLSPRECEWLEQYLAQHTQARAELAWYQSLQQRMRDQALSVPDTVGWGKMQARLQAEASSSSPVRTWWQRWHQRLSGLYGHPAWALACVVVMMVQGGVIASWLSTDAEADHAQLRSLKAVPAQEGTALKVNFMPELKEVDLRHILIQVRGEIVAGPGQLGDYYVRVPEGTQAQAQARLQALPQVQRVTEVPGVPPRD